MSFNQTQPITAGYTESLIRSSLIKFLTDEKVEVCRRHIVIAGLDWTGLD